MQKEYQRKIFEVYITDALYAISNKQMLLQRYAEVAKIIPQDNRSGEEVVADVVKSAGLEIK